MIMKILYDISINIQSIHDNENLFFTISNLDTNSFSTTLNQYTGGMLYPRHKTPQGQPVAKYESHLEIILVGCVNLMQRSFKAAT